MFSILLITFGLLLNTAGALGIHSIVDDSVRKKYLSPLWVKVLLLVPPVSIVVSFSILFYGVLFLIYLALSNYFSNN